MTPDEYIAQSARTASDKYFIDAVPSDIMHAIIGLSTECGESLDALKKTIFYGKSLDLVNLDEEIGDKLWYIAMYCRARGISIESLMDRNINKLKVRFPEKFTQENALVRDLASEREVLESGDNGYNAYRDAIKDDY